MEKINTDYKQRIWKIEAKLFNMRKPWVSSFKWKAWFQIFRKLEDKFWRSGEWDFRNTRSHKILGEFNGFRSLVFLAGSYVLQSRSLYEAVSESLMPETVISF